MIDRQTNPLELKSEYLQGIREAAQKKRAVLDWKKQKGIYTRQELQEFERQLGSAQVVEELPSEQIPEEPVVPSYQVLEGVTGDFSPRELVGKLNITEQYDLCLFFMGGADKVSAEVRDSLEGLIVETVSTLASSHKILGLTGGTNSGIMAMVGEARKKALSVGNGFPLVGVAPKENLRYGTWIGHSGVRTDQVVAADPNHTHIIPVDSQLSHVGEYGCWGNETELMYALAKIISQDKLSIGIMANGGGITGDEVIQNMKQDRKVIVLSGTGRLADGLAAWITELKTGKEAYPEPESDASAELAKFKKKLAAANIGMNIYLDNFIVMETLSDGSAQLVQLIETNIAVPASLAQPT